VNKKEMIDTVSVGIGHSVVRTKLGYVYSWGDNRSGQVALQKTDVIHIPIVLEQDKQKLKALQAVASLRATYLLL
jgi:alpha-tubulin suppressor-like RCC1 family protein